MQTALLGRTGFCPRVAAQRTPCQSQSARQSTMVRAQAVATDNETGLKTMRKGVKEVSNLCRRSAHFRMLKSVQKKAALLECQHSESAGRQPLLPNLAEGNAVGKHSEAAPHACPVMLNQQSILSGNTQCWQAGPSIATPSFDVCSRHVARPLPFLRLGTRAMRSTAGVGNETRACNAERCWAYAGHGTWALFVCQHARGSAATLDALADLQASSESVLTPRFYTTDFDEMELLFSQKLNPNLDMAELEVGLL